MLVALGLLILVVILAGVGPTTMRVPALVGFMALLFAMQLIVLWANRDLVTPYTQAQRRFLAEDFEAARDILEGNRAKLDARGLTLLGNTYRQLGRLDESERALRDALAQAPDHHFPLYGLGRTLLARGRYADAAETIRAALAAGAPDTVRADLGEALYRAGKTDEARVILQAIDVSQIEPYRALMVGYLLADRLDSMLVAAGLPYWQAAAQRFGDMPYGRALAEDVRRLKNAPAQSESG